MLLIMLVAGVGAKSLPLARGEGGVRGIMITCQLPINFSVDNLEYIYNIVSYVNSMKKVNFHGHFFIILDS